MRGRHGRVREGAGRLAGPGTGIDPGLVEEIAPELGQLRRESAVGVEHDPARLGPVDRPVRIFRQRRVAVPIVEPILAEPARLEPVIAVRERRIGRLYRRDQRIHHLVLDLVREVARRDRARQLAPAVLDLLVLGQRVGDEREALDPLAEPGGERLCRLAPEPRIAVGEQVSTPSTVSGLPSTGKRMSATVSSNSRCQAADPAMRFSCSSLLHLVGELVRAEGAHAVAARAGSAAARDRPSSRRAPRPRCG